VDEEVAVAKKRKVEVFSAGCGVCDEAVELVTRLAGGSCDIQVLDMKDPAVAKRAKKYGVRSVPAIAVDGRLAGCCAGRGPDEESLRAAGIGAPR
jgi:glutaredoxin 3